MIINLLHAYKGKASNYEKLLACIQGVTDELGEYLVTNGHAIAIETPKAETVTEIKTAYTIGVDFAGTEQDSTIETLVELSHDEPVTVAEVSSDNPDVQVSISNATVSKPATAPTVKPSKLHKPQSKR